MQTYDQIRYRRCPECHTVWWGSQIPETYGIGFCPDDTCEWKGPFEDMKRVDQFGKAVRR
jgi:hypothetical protein